MTDLLPRLRAALDGRYRVDGLVGEGGMATVYVAEDVRHERKVALKVLKPELSAVVGAERFLSEIKTTAGLQHPHILPLHDSGEADGLLFYVMPYVEGESLRDRLERDKQLPVDEAVRIATAVAGAIHAAHQAGVIHRDLKPANILLRSGEPLVADFGIALAVGVAGSERLTETGLSLGTPYYMSPEQATGDQRLGPASDTYALGCILFEMLSGEPPYPGVTAQAVLGKIISGEAPSVTAQRHTVPANVDHAIRKALEKLPADRFRSAEEFAHALADPSFRHGPDSPVPVGAGPWRAIALVATAAAAALAGVALTALREAPPEVEYFTRRISPDTSARLGPVRNGRPWFNSLAFAPDGRSVVYSLDPGGLWVSRFDRPEAEPVRGAERGMLPMYSPDGAWLAFFEAPNDGFSRVSLADGSVQPLVTAEQSRAVVEEAGSNPVGVAWGDDGRMYASFENGLIMSMETGGGRARVDWRPSDTVPGARAPRYGPIDILGGARAVLRHRRNSSDPLDSDVVWLDLETGTESTLIENGMDPRYLRPGYLVFLSTGVLRAARLDAASGEVLGEHVPVLDDVMHAVYRPLRSTDIGAGQYAVTRAGHLAYVRGGVFPTRSPAPLRFTASGDTTRLNARPGASHRIRVSPSGDRIAYSSGPFGAFEIYVHDIEREQTRRLDTGPGNVDTPVWSADGTSLLFGSDQEGGTDQLYRMPVDGSARPERVAPSSASQTPGDWSVDGVIAYLEGGDIWILPPDEAPRPFFESEPAEAYPDFSPDGAWLVYTSEGGVYVRPYPGPGAPVLVASPGVSPSWSPDGRRIHYVSGGRLLSVDMQMVAGSAVPGRPEVLVSGWSGVSGPARRYDVFPDGSFVNVPIEQERASNPTEIQIVLNFVELLEERLGR